MTDSTNLQALRAWRDSPPQPLLVSADVQTAGRGRTGRPWCSPVGGLWMTVAWPLVAPADHYVALPPAVGLAVARAVGRICRLDAAIKWPNDLLVNGRKLCGILCQYEAAASPPVLLVGIGINGNYAAAQLGNDLRQPPTTLLDETGRETDLAQLRNTIAHELSVTLKQYDQRGLAPMLDALRQRLAWRDEQVACDLPDGSSVTGRLIDVDLAGRLVLDDRGRTRQLDVGDIHHLRPFDAGARPNNLPVSVSEFSICPS